MTRKAYMYSAQEQAGRMAARINEFMDKERVKNAREIKHVDCIVMLERILSNELDARSLWATPRSHDDLFHDLLPWTCDLDHGPAYEQFYSDVIIKVVREVNRWIEAFMPSEHGYNGKSGIRRSWVIWYVRAVGRDILVEEGPDFRIKDWTDRMTNGEWQGSTSIFAMEEPQAYGEHRDDIEIHGDYIDQRDTEDGPRINARRGKVPADPHQERRTRELLNRTAAPPSSVDNIPSILNEIRGKHSMQSLIGKKAIGYGTGDI